MEKMTNSAWRSDITGGVVASIVTLPKAMAYATVAFAPLGPDYLPLGILAGMLALIFGNLITIGRSNGIVINSTFSLASMMLASALTFILNHTTELPAAEQIPLALTLLFLVMFFSGVFQVIAGVLKMGSLVKYIPQPVISGLVNGVAILIVTSQLPAFLNVPDHPDVSGLQQLAYINWSLVGIGLVTMLALVYGPFFISRIPPVFIGIALGCAAFYGIAWLQGSAPGTTLQGLPSGIPQPLYLIQFLQLDSSQLPLVVDLLPFAMAVAAVLSLWSLLFMASADNLLAERSNGNHELVGQGLGNMLLSLFGGVVVAGNSNTLVNYANGGRNTLSKFSCGLFSLLILLFLGPLISLLPTIVLASLLIAFSIQAIDKWSVKLGKIAIGGDKESREGVPDLLIMLAVMLIMLTIGVFAAVGAGIAISLILFIYRMGREIIRQDRSGKQLRSNVVRCHAERQLLKEQGDKIRVIEIEGALFFGTTDAVSNRIQDLNKQDVDTIILDMKRITDVDSTGSELLLRLRHQCQRFGQQLLLSGIDTREADNAFLQKMGTLDVFSSQGHFISLLDALAEAENNLLDKIFGQDRYSQITAINNTPIFAGLTAQQRDDLSQYVVYREFQCGEQIFAQDAAADSIFVVLKGQVTLKIQSRLEPVKVVATLCPGFVFGEMALVKERKRYSSALALGPVTCIELTNEQLHQLHQDNPALAFQLLANISTDLSERLARAAKSSANYL
ncbi:SLC26A/SulP transporter family protein [Neptunicella sp.]|uniref:SLC26A/SulP transporter family protein n=1 Tax=Neptunicella sp. TaxID=2125986 RepID=UPI003F69010E